MIFYHFQDILNIKKLNKNIWKNLTFKYVFIV